LTSQTLSKGRKTASNGKGKFSFNYSAAQDPLFPRWEARWRGRGILTLSQIKATEIPLREEMKNLKINSAKGLKY